MAWPPGGSRGSCWSGSPPSTETARWATGATSSSARVNDISRPGVGFDAIDNEVTILAADGSTRRVARASKERVAAAVLDEVEQLRARKEGTNGASRADTGSAARV